jgi:hypothetical protein
MTPGLLRSTDPTSARTRRGRQTQSVFPDSSAEIAAILGWANAEGVPVVRPERFSGSRRAANARNRVYAIVHNSNVKGPQRRMHRAIARQSSPIVASLEHACHAGGRGFESRRSRLSKCLHLGRLCCPSGREQWAGGPIKRRANDGALPVAACGTRACWREGRRIRYEPDERPNRGQTATHLCR